LQNCFTGTACRPLETICKIVLRFSVWGNNLQNCFTLPSLGNNLQNCFTGTACRPLETICKIVLHFPSLGKQFAKLFYISAFQDQILFIQKNCNSVKPEFQRYGKQVFLDVILAGPISE